MTEGGTMITRGKWLVCLGGGWSQVPLVREACRRGVNVIVFDQNPDAPANKYSHKFYPISTHDADAVLKRIIELKKEVGIIGILMYSSSRDALCTAARVAKSCGVKLFTIEDVSLLASRSTIIASLHAAGLSVPESRTVRSAAEAISVAATIGYPVVLKPVVGGTASRGVFIINREDELLAHFNAPGADQGTIIEQFLSGEEYVVQGYIQNGQACPLPLFRKHTVLVGGRPIHAGYESAEGAAVPNFKDLFCEISRTLKLPDYIFAADIIFRNGTPYIIDVGFLLDAGMEKFLEQSGVHIYSLLVDIATNKKTSLEQPHPLSPCALSFIYAKSQGVFSIPETIGNILPPGVSIEWERHLEGECVMPPSSVDNILGMAIAVSQESSVIAYKRAQEAAKLAQNMLK